MTVTASIKQPRPHPTPESSLTPVPNAIGSLLYTPAANQIGDAVITVTVKDNGGTAFGGVDEFTRTFTVTVNAVPDAPTVDTTRDPNAPGHAAASRADKPGRFTRG